MGDSVMAVFGVPVAHDDDAERAVAAGLAMRELGGDLAFSIGINSGEVMAATVGRAGDFTVIGDTVNVAARLEKVASAGEVLCGRLTVDLAGRGAVFRERRPVLLKGKREPVEVWEAVRPPPDGRAAGRTGPPIGGATSHRSLRRAGLLGVAVAPGLPRSTCPGRDASAATPGAARRAFWQSWRARQNATAPSCVRRIPPTARWVARGSRQRSSGSSGLWTTRR